MTTIKSEITKVKFSIFNLWILSIIYFLVITFTGLSDWFSMHSYRQSQTALTCLYFPIDGYKIDYTTPMMGYPWKVPMEFPIYQFIISILVQLFKTDIIITGKVFYILLHVINNILILKIFRRFNIDNHVCFLTLILFNVSPYYLVWAPSFLPDYFGLFLTILAITILQDYFKLKSRLMFAAFVVISITCVLNKITTYITTLLPLASFCIVYNYKDEFYEYFIKPWKLKSIKLHWFFLFGVLLIVLLIGIQWTKYCDVIKAENPFSSQWISSKPEIILWNLGTLTQRLNLNWWTRYFGYSMIYNPLFYLIIITIAIIASIKNYRIVVAITCFFLPPLIFFNLFHEHNYYSIINIIFLYYIISETIQYLVSIHKKIGIAFACIIFTFIAYRTFVFKNLIFQPNKSEIPWSTIDFHPHVNDVILSIGQARDPSINFFFHCRGLNLNYEELQKIVMDRQNIEKYTKNSTVKMVCLIDDKPSVWPSYLSAIFKNKMPYKMPLFFENKYYTFYWIN